MESFTRNMSLRHRITEVYVCHNLFRLHLSHIRISSLAPPLRQRLGPAACSSWQLPGVFDDEGDCVSARDAAAEEEGQEGAEGQVEEDHCRGHSKAILDCFRNSVSDYAFYVVWCDQCHQWRFFCLLDNICSGEKGEKDRNPSLILRGQSLPPFHHFPWALRHLPTIISDNPCHCHRAPTQLHLINIDIDSKQTTSLHKKQRFINQTSQSNSFLEPDWIRW